MSFIGSTTAYPTVIPAVADFLPLVQGGALQTATAGSLAQLPGAVTVNAQTGTTYTYLTGDRNKLVTHTNGSAIAGTLPQAGSTGFESAWFMFVENRGAGTLTITPATSTIDGASSLALTTNQGCLIVSDGTNYFTMRGIGGGGSGTVTSVAAANGVETTSGVAITATGTIRGAVVVNTETGTTYTYVAGDRGALVTHTNVAAIAGTLPQAGTTGFEANWFTFVQNRGAGTLTITPTTSTIDGAASLALTTGQGVLVVSDGTNYFTMRGLSAGGGSLTNFTESIDTASPNNVINAARLLATGSTTDIDFVASPKGDGAFQLDRADNTSTGGNKRGADAVDLQRSRGANTQVASGARSFSAGSSNTASGTGSVAIGSTNVASGTNSTAIGGSNTSSNISAVALGGSCEATAASSVAVGQFCIASGANAVAYGQSCTADATDSCAHGRAAITRGTQGSDAYSCGVRNNDGDAQRREVILRRQTTDATPIRAISSTGGITATNQLGIPIRSTFLIQGTVAAHRQSNNDYKTWTFQGTLNRTTGGTVSLGSAITPAVVDAAAGASGWAVSVTADDTDKVLNVSVTGEASATISWTVRILSTECTT